MSESRVEELRDWSLGSTGLLGFGGLGLGLGLDFRVYGLGFRV